MKSSAKIGTAFYQFLRLPCLVNRVCIIEKILAGVKMADSDEENDQDFEQMNMTGFLFGNIDKNGELEDDILDSTAKQHLASLGQLGLNSLLREMIPIEENNAESESDASAANAENGTDDDDDTNYVNKAPSTLDFSDIDELAEDLNEEKVPGMARHRSILGNINNYTVLQ